MMSIRIKGATGASILFVLALAGCSTPTPRPAAAGHAPATAAGNPGAAASRSPARASPVDDVTINDVRPQTEKVYSIHSLWVSSCNYGIYTVPDATAGTPRLVRLHTDLSSMPGNPLKGHTVTLSHYAVYYNPSRKLKAGAWGSAFGGIAGALIASSGKTTKGSTCAADKVSGGWYAANELKTGYPPVIIEIEGSVDGRTQKTRVVYSPKRELSPKMKNAEDAVEIDAAMRMADLSFADALTKAGVNAVATVNAPAPAGPADTQAARVVEPAATPAPSDEGWINFPAK